MAEDNDILTLAEARAALNQGTQTSNDTRITALVTAISERIDDNEDGLGPVVIRQPPQETHDGAGTCIQLKFWPVATIVTVTEDGTTLAAADYHIDSDTGLLYRRSGNYDRKWCEGRANIVVDYTAGRYASTAAVPEKFKQGARLFIKHQWSAEQWGEETIGEFDVPQVRFPAFAIPNAVREWFGGLWRGQKGGFA